MPTSHPIASASLEPDEYSPLLTQDNHGEPQPSSAPPATTVALGSPQPTGRWTSKTRTPLFVVVLCTVCVLAIDVGIFMQLAPLTRILEVIICHAYYKRHPDMVNFHGPIPEEMCKISSIQGELAMLRGWSGLFDCLPALLLAMPYGYIADRHGRKLVVILATIGAILGNIWTLVVCRFPDVFPIKLIWLAPAFSIIGGGASVASSIILTIVADVVTPSQRITASVLMAQLIAIPLSSVLMEQNLWLPMYLGTGAMTFGGMILIVLPETLSASPSHTSSNQGEDLANDSAKVTTITDLTERSKKMISDLRSIFISPLMVVLILTFLVNSLGRSAVELLLQYASYRYHWTIAQASFLLPLRAAIQLALLLLILPYLSYLLITRMSIEAKAKDLWISRGSVAMLLVGSLGIGISPNPVLMAFCSGFATAIRSLATSMVDSHQVARLYAMMTVTDMLGGMLAGPSLSALYAWGLDMGGAWVGLPFIASGVLFLLVAVPLCCART